jgi:arginyl-tRNA synthetase
MNILAELRDRFAAPLRALVDGEIDSLLDMIKPSQDAKFGDYQANCAMPLGKRLGQQPREVAQQIVDAIDIADFCKPPEIAGPGFINLTIRDDWLEAQLNSAVNDERIGVPVSHAPKTFVIDYSAPNVAKPMHVGHIRSSVIGDALCRTLRFLGHQVIGDNHIGDWGTQFGMIIYGFKNFVDQPAYEQNAVGELARLYRLVNQLVDYQRSRTTLPRIEERIEKIEQQIAELNAAPPSGDKKEEKKSAKALRKLESQLSDARGELAETQKRISAVEDDASLAALAQKHADIAEASLAETASLHAGDETNRELWEQFLPACLEDIDRIYRRLGIQFDHTLGESFYQDRLAPVVADLRDKGIARESDGAVCVFFDGQDVPMIVQKKDGAFLYATTDLATIQYRGEKWSPDAILYVVDHRQSLHFEHLFETAMKWGFADTQFVHVKFGTVLGDDGRPFKTRSGDTVGLDGLLDEAVRKAHTVVSENDDARPEPELSESDREDIADVVGIAALKYADLSQNRESDYVFSYDKMLALNGNTAAYMQYAYARILNIFARDKVAVPAIGQFGAAIAMKLQLEKSSGNDNREESEQANIRIQTEHRLERALGIALLQFAEALAMCASDLRPNHLTGYLYELAEKFSNFYVGCWVLKADSKEKKRSRIALCKLTAHTLKTGLSLLGIDVVEKM